MSDEERARGIIREPTQAEVETDAAVEAVFEGWGFDEHIRAMVRHIGMKCSEHAHDGHPGIEFDYWTNVHRLLKVIRDIHY